LGGVLSTSQQIHVTQCFGGTSHSNLICPLTLYLTCSHVLDFWGHPLGDELREISEVHGLDFVGL